MNRLLSIAGVLVLLFLTACETAPDTPPGRQASRTPERPATFEPATSADIDPAAIEAVLRGLLPKASPRAIIDSYAGIVAERIRQGADLARLQGELAGLLCPLVPGEDRYGTACRVLDGWEQDGHSVPTVDEFFAAGWAGVRDWELFYTLTYLGPVLAEYQDWRALQAYARYRNGRTRPVGLKEFCADPAKYQ